MEYLSHFLSPAGRIGIVTSEEELVALTFNLEKLKGEYSTEEPPVMKKVKAWLESYFSFSNPRLDFPIHVEGTQVQMEVWDILRTIPYGRTMTYGEIAELIASRHKIRKMSAQAVGGAVGSNRLPIVIPCHRVLGKGGTLTGYAEGLERKRMLLDIEGAEYKH